MLQLREANGLVKVLNPDEQPKYHLSNPKQQRKFHDGGGDLRVNKADQEAKAATKNQQTTCTKRHHT
jgi:hypothetical protein